MKKIAQKAACFATALLTAAGAACVAARIPAGAGALTADAAAGFILPAGNAAAFFGGTGSVSSPAVESASPGAGTSAASSAAASQAQPAASAASSAASSAQVPQTQSGDVLELTIGEGGTQVDNFWVKNTTELHASLDLAAELAQPPALMASSGTDAPQVLIYHTHTTESYDCVARTSDLSKTVCAVGDAIAAALEEAGVKTIHDTTVHDSPAYDGSYDRSRETMEKDLAQYPSIRVTLDIHRDAMHRDDGTMLKPTAVVNGQKAAQVMILAGCDDDGSLGFPDWEQNLRLALRLQQSLAQTAPGLARPLDFCARRYNENLTPGSLLIEVGTDANTLSEAVYSGTLLGRSLAGLLSAS
jgi:stage II sporulation protein P